MHLYIIILKTSDYIKVKINKFPRGYVFTYNDFITEVNNKEAIIKSLNRMVASGKINKLSKGKYYKPETNAFGNMQPDQYQIVKDLLEKDGKLIGYLTAYGIYNQLGLTTQVSNTIQIGRNETKPSLQRGMYKIAFIKQKNTITKENIPLLQILDAIKYIRIIPDTTVSASCTRLMAIIKTLTPENRSLLVKLALKYSPFTRALLGALLEQSGSYAITNPLKKSLNPITVYKLFGVGEVLPNAANWNIKL